MASPFQGITDDPRTLNTQVYTPDYSFLQSQLARSTDQYEKGLSQVKNDYSNILNQSVLGQEATDRKKQYVDQVQQGLKKIATTDLSLPQNVAQAESLYAPFWKDEALLTNIGLTRMYTGENSKLDSWENSTDKDVRSQYNKYSRLDIQNGMQQVANAPFDKNAYNKLERRQATPFYDIDADVDTAWQKENGTDKAHGVSTTTSDGFGALLTEYNGIKSKDAYKTYYLSKLASGKYDPQIQVMSRVQNEQAKSEILRANPQLTDQHVNEQFANENMYHLGVAYKSTADNYTNQGNFWDKKYKDLVNQIKNNQKGIANSDQESNLKYYASQRQGYTDQANQYSKTFWNDYSPVTVNGKPNDNYNKNLQDLIEHPNDHISAIQRDRMADNWATGRASISSQKKELDPVWKEYQDIAWHRDQMTIDRQRIQAELRGQELGYQEKTGHTLQGEMLPGFNPYSDHGWYGTPTGTNGIPSAPVGRVIGLNTIEPGKLPAGLDIIQQTLHNKEMIVADNIYNPDRGGISNIVLGKLGLSQNEIIDFTEAQKGAMSGVTSPEGKVVTTKVQQLLQEHGIDMKDIHGPRGMMTALSQYGASVAKQLHTSDNEVDKNTAIDLALSIQKANQLRDSYIATQKNFDNAYHQELINNPKYSKITNPATGREYSAEEMAHDFPSVQLTDNNGHVVKELSPLQFAQLKRADKVEMLGQNTLKVDGVNYGIGRVNGINSSTWGVPAGTVLERELKIKPGSIESKYGAPGEITDLKKQAAANIVPKMKEFKNGIIAQEIAYDPNSSNPAEAKRAQDLAPEIALPSNTEGKPYYLETGNNQKHYLKPEDEDKFRDALVTDLKTKAGAIGKTMNDEGSEVYKVHFKLPSEGDDKPFPLAGKTIYIAQSPNATGPTMQSIPKNSGLYIYGDVLDGGSYKEDPTVKALGMTYNWRGYGKNSLGQTTKSNVEIKRTIPDPENTGKTLDIPVVQATILHSGPDAKTVDEIGDAINRQVANHLAQVKQNTYSAHRNITTGKHISQIESEIKSNQ